MNGTLRRWSAALLAGLLFLLPAIASAQGLININTASAEELQALPGIGATKAAAIVDYRAANGPFGAVDELTHVTGIGAGTLNNIRSLVTVGDVPPREAAEFDGSPAMDLTGDDSSLGEPSADRPPPPRDRGDSPPAGGLINVNTASAEELQALPGIGPVKAAAIVEYRQSHGRFRTVEQLDDVSGIGPATLNNIRALCTVE